MSNALKFGGFFGGSILGTVGLNAGVTALLRKGLGSTLSYTPAMIAGGTATTAFIATMYFTEPIKGLFSEKKVEKLNLLRFGCTLLLGGMVAELLSREVTKTQACALSVLSFFTSHLVVCAIIRLIKPITKLYEEYKDAGMWLVGMGK